VRRQRFCHHLVSERHPELQHPMGIPAAKTEVDAAITSHIQPTAPAVSVNVQAQPPDCADMRADVAGLTTADQSRPLVTW
jgi:hypothetical protein